MKCKCFWSMPQYNEEHDAMFCDICKQWLEKACTDPECPLCVDRPERAPENGKIGNIWIRYYGSAWVEVANSEEELKCGRSTDLTKKDLKLLLENWPDETTCTEKES